MQTDSISLFNDDCINVLKEITSETIDCLITDCPYNIVPGGCTNKEGSTSRYTSGILNRNNTDVKQGKVFAHNNIEFDKWLPEAYRVLKSGTHCYVMINARNLKELQEAAEKAGFVFQNLLVWDKGNATPNKYYMNACELILMLRKGRARNINNMGTTNILRVPNILRNKKHPTEKPADLMRIMVENSTNENEIVLDPFMGAGG